MGVSITQFRFQKPGIHYQKSDQEKVDYPKQSAVSVDLKDYPEGNEIIGCHFSIQERLYNGHNVRVAVEFYDDDTGDLLWKGSANIPQPSDSGYSWWSYYNYYFWIGHLQWEIRKAMTVRMECHIWGEGYGESGLGSISNRDVTLKMQITDSSYVAPDPDDPVTPVKKGKRVEFYYKDASKYIGLFNPTAAFIGGGVSKLIENKADLIWKVKQAMPLGYKLLEVNIDSDKLSLKFEETGSVWAVVGIIAAVVAVLIIFGLIIRSWKVYDWKKEQAKAEQEEEETDQRQNDNDLIQDLIDAGVIQTPDDAVKVITALNERDEDEIKDDDLFGNIKEILMFAFMGVIVILLIQQMGKGG